MIFLCLFLFLLQNFKVNEIMLELCVLCDILHSFLLINDIYFENNYHISYSSRLKELFSLFPRFKNLLCDSNLKSQRIITFLR